jgi:isopentenyl phosphate kinase
MRVLRLNLPRVTILKIGGSVITEKSEELTPRTQDINRLAEEIKNASVQSLIIVHGGGSFGHPLAQKYSISSGFKERDQQIGFAETHHVMTVLNGLFMDSLVCHGIPAVSVTPSSFIMTVNGRIKSFEETTLRAFMEMKFLPVIYGDAVLDSALGFTILSGDQLVAHLAMKFNAERIIIGVDVDGLYDADPKTVKTAKICKHLKLADLKTLQGKLCKPTSCDVTGGMLGKITELLPVIELGIPAMVVNATRPNYIYNALKGEDFEGTLIEKE